MSTLVAEQFDYKGKKFETPNPNQYRYAKLYPQNASQSQPLAVGATSQVTFELPSDPYNLSRAFLQYTISPIAVAGSNSITWKDLMNHINQIQLVSRQQILIADLQNVPLYTKAAWKQEIKYEDYKTFEDFDNNVGYGCMLRKQNAQNKNSVATVDIAGANYVQSADKLRTYRVYPCFNPASTNINAGNTVPIQFSLCGSSMLTANVTGAGPHDQTPSSTVQYDEPQYFEISQNQATPFTYNIKFPLRLLLNTIFSVDKDLYFNGEIMYLKIFFSPSTAISFISTVPDAAVASAGGYCTQDAATLGHPGSDMRVNAAPNVVTYTIAATTAATNLTNLTLWLPINRDPDVKDSLKKIIDNGEMKLNIPFVWTLNQSFVAGTVVTAGQVTTPPTSTAENVTIKVNSSHGKRLQKIYYTIVNGDGNGALSNLQYDISNLGYVVTVPNNTNVALNTMANGLQIGYKIQQFQTFLDNKPLQDYIVNCTTGDDYTLQMPYLKDSLILDSSMFAYNWCWVERFDDLLSPADKPFKVPNSNLEVGLDLSVEHKYDFVSICNPYSTLVHYAFLVAQRELHITNQGIFLDQTV